MTSAMRHQLFNLRISDWQQRSRLKLVSEESQPKSAEPENHHNIHPVNSKRAFVELRARQPDQIHESHYDDRYRDYYQPSGVALQIARQEQHKRKRELKHDKREPYPLPRRL